MPHNTPNQFIDIIDYHSHAKAELNWQTNGQEQDENFNYKLTNQANPFSDCGAWHGLYLPATTNNSFFGPLILDQEIPVNAGQYCSNYVFSSNKQDYTLLTHNSYSMPGKLIIDQTYDHFTIHKELIFINGRTSVVKTTINNLLDTVLSLNLKVQGVVYHKVKYSSKNAPNDWKSLLLNVNNNDYGVLVKYKSLVNAAVNEQFSLQFKTKIEHFSTTSNANETHYTFNLTPMQIAAKTSHTLYEVQQFDFSHEISKIDWNHLDQAWNENTQRWSQYINNIAKHVNTNYLSLAIKALQTLISNWRSPAGALKHDSFVPSICYTDFIGAWSWDTWKISVGVCLFDQTLAKSMIHNIFDYQITDDDHLRPHDAGMIPDCIFFNQHPDRNGVGNNWNERNTKSSIAAWSVLFIYEQTNDLKFLQEIYPKIKAYNLWWNRNRSYKHDNILQFGATVDKLNDWNHPKSIIEAAAWESGMDNAPRFDWDSLDVLKVFGEQKELIGYVIDQASVDLNAFNYLELVSLAKIAKILKLEDEAHTFTISAGNVKQWINTYCYDEHQKCFYDVKLNTNQLVNQQGKGDECLVSLFANAADDIKAQAVINSLNTQNYLTLVCFPSVAADSKKFDATNYWRGPVWLDQWYFGLKGLANYNHKALAKKLLTSSLLHMEKILQQGPIMENYNPLTGKGLATTNFSWSASMLLMALKEIDLN